MDVNFKEKGNYTLGAIFSITVGIAFLLGVVNLTRYAYAVNAVEQASRSVARCLTPTDSECLDLDSISTQKNIEVTNSIPEWFGIKKCPPIIFSPDPIECNQQQTYFQLDDGQVITKPEDCKIDPTICNCLCSCCGKYNYFFRLNNSSETTQFSSDSAAEPIPSLWSTNCPAELGEIVALSTDFAFSYNNNPKIFMPQSLAAGNYLDYFNTINLPENSSVTKIETTVTINGDNKNCKEQTSEVVTSVVERVTLGRSKERPEACAAFDDCQNENETMQALAFKDLSSNEQATQIAKQKGYAEIARAFANYLPNCNNQANCSQISITQNGSNALIDVSYNLQLTFPFDLLLKDFLPVRTRKEEAMELFIE
ncbi:MAG: hypothetical protein LBE20_01895 [Deltaproteobacteria bacterium]|jgi:hypothetical protein|nr:hypothetical protein [Deltaproteobacteria bacterium]